MIFYALIGIPMNGFLFAYLGDFFGKVVRISPFDGYILCFDFVFLIIIHLSRLYLNQNCWMK